MSVLDTNPPSAKQDGREAQVWRFFALAYGMSWLAWVPLALLPGSPRLPRWARPRLALDEAERQAAVAHLCAPTQSRTSMMLRQKGDRTMIATEVKRPVSTEQAPIGAKRPVVVEPRPVQEPYTLARSIILHLAPGAIFTTFILLAAPALASWGIDPVFALFGGIGLVLVPLELGYLAVHARQTTGSWSPLNAVDYKERVPAGRLALLAVGLVVWFLAGLMVSVAFLDTWLATHVFAWMPNVLLQFAVVEAGGEPLTGGALVAFLLIALAFNGIAGPITEELYFRGHLLPRLERYGRWAPVINTVLFGIYHFFSPWRYPAIILGFLPITWAAWRRRSVFVSIAAHMTINTITVLLIFAAALGGQ
jgi:membrane protease YdiL (CAAX protease family)